MQCLKCGRETTEGQVFCDACLAVMVKNPVKPNTAVNIPERPRRRRSQVKKPTAVEELQEALQRKVMQLRLWICVLLVGLTLCSTLLLLQIVQNNARPSIGQNYHSVTEIGHSGGR